MARRTAIGRMLLLVVVCLIITALFGVFSVLDGDTADVCEPGELAGRAVLTSEGGLQILSASGSISGVVQDEAGAPIEGAHVVVQGGDWSSDNYTGVDGSYAIVGLSPGVYGAYAQASGYLTEPYANPVAVEELGGTTGIDFVLRPDGSISGVVLDAAGNPIEGVFVVAVSGDEYSRHLGCTGADGSYTVGDLDTGSYVVSAGASGYLTEYYGDVYDGSLAAPVAVTLPNDTPGIDFTLGPGGSISGVVLDGAGDPIEGALVVAVGDDTLFSHESYTAADGSYAIADLCPESYVVRAEASGYVTEFYDDVYEESLATPVAVTPPNKTSAIDFALVSSGSISGVVRDEAGAPIVGAVVVAIISDDLTSYSHGTTRADGSYTIAGLGTGSYVMWATASGYMNEYYDNVYAPSQATPVAVTLPNETPGIDFTLQPTATISGVVRDEAGAPIYYALVKAEGDDSATSDYTGADGTYAITGLTVGNYVVSAEADGYTTEYYFNVHGPSLATPVTVAALADLWGIDFTLGPSGPMRPAVTTGDATSVTLTSARLNGSLASPGTASSVTVSFVWGTSSGQYPNETTGEVKTTTGTFYFDLASLDPGMSYYYRAKAAGDDTGYGVERILTTGNTWPAVNTGNPSAITTESAILTGNLTGLGTAASVELSFEWGETTAYGNITTPQTMTGTGPFSFTVTGLSAAHAYHFRAKAAGDGTTWGAHRAFTTPPPTSPRVTTTDPSAVTAHSAILGGDLASPGGAASVQASFEWGLTTSYGQTTPPQTMTSTGLFSADISGLAGSGTIYHYRAKAAGDGTVWGADRWFRTELGTTPSVTTGNPSAITAHSVALSGNLGGLGTAASVQVSFEWGLTTSYGNSIAPEFMTNPGTFSFALSGLSPAHTYYYRAKAAGDGTTWGAQRAFTTQSAVPPSLTTEAASGVGIASVTLNGNMTSLGTALSVQASFEWGLTTSYGNETMPQKMSKTDTFSASVSGLTPGTTYYFRAKAVGDRTAYGSDATFTTLAPPTAVVEPGAQEVAKGGTFSVDIMVDPSGYGVSGGELNITFDPSAMSVVDIVFGGLFGANPLVGAKQIDNTLGTAKYALARVGETTPPTTAGMFAKLTFTAKSKAGTYAIDITSIGLADDNFNDIQGIVITDGNVTVAYPRWDINQDGKVDYKDLAILGAHYGETMAQPPYPAWDINQDGKVDYKDLAILGAHYGEVY